jgi:hypothetical protein
MEFNQIHIPFSGSKSMQHETMTKRCKIGGPVLKSSEWNGEKGKEMMTFFMLRYICNLSCKMLGQLCGIYR